ncbi:hypothetical protein OP10G_1658 [Fimbriimonas ginsengisoli Gsoil 348]|uniref:Uncharacterized protein n=1 Tax=Fimbriimonas ginsengisoli Gsoil 348 TaxID=661478 RepID=A0A068NNJ7_FIMGI|nr:hypothetical protein OP10G_1658 [Fimbriimonas ginsengisoli Gsoil 348]
MSIYPLRGLKEACNGSADFSSLVPSGFSPRFGKASTEVDAACELKLALPF